MGLDYPVKFETKVTMTLKMRQANAVQNNTFINKASVKNPWPSLLRADYFKYQQPPALPISGLGSKHTVPYSNIIRAWVLHVYRSFLYISDPISVRGSSARLQ